MESWPCIGSGDSGDDDVDQHSGMNAIFCFPALTAEFDCQALLSLGCSKHSLLVSFHNVNAGNFSSILYKEEEEFIFGSLINTTNDTPGSLHEKPFVSTELTQHQFGQCALLVGAALENFPARKQKKVWFHVC
jgi:hypothetical protein